MAFIFSGSLGIQNSNPNSRNNPTTPEINGFILRDYTNANNSSDYLKQRVGFPYGAAADATILADYEIGVGLHVQITGADSGDDYQYWAYTPSQGEIATLADVLAVGSDDTTFTGVPTEWAAIGVIVLAVNVTKLYQVSAFFPGNSITPHA